MRRCLVALLLYFSSRLLLSLSIFLSFSIVASLIISRVYLSPGRSESMAFHLTWKPNLYFKNITFLHGESMVWGYSECEESKQEATTLAQVTDGCFKNRVVAMKTEQRNWLKIFWR